MSTAPNGFQTPKTNWQAADVPTPTDFNRIEGNLQAIEEGSRIVDQTQSPSGLAGSLRQFLDWISNRIKAILGTTNWYDSPPVTLTVAKNHIDNKSNPHNVTAAQVGAAPSSHTHDNRYYTESEMDTKIAAKVTGPESAVNNNITVFDGVTGKAVKDSGKPVAGLAYISSGSYTGNDVAGREISVGFTPKKVFVTSLGEQCTIQDGGGFYHKIGGSSSHYFDANMVIVDNGFSTTRVNTSENTYYWVAIA